MKLRFFFLTTLLPQLLAMEAQTSGNNVSLDAPMQSYLDFCLEERAAAYPVLNCQRMEQLVEESDRYRFLYKGNEIILSPNMTLTEESENSVVSTKGHLLFQPDFIDSVLVECSMPDIIGELTVMRGGESNCFITHHMLDAHAIGKYSYIGSGDMQLFAVADNGGLVKLTVSSGSGAKETFKYQDTATEKHPAAVLHWLMQSEGKVCVTVENISDHPVRFVLASN